MLYRILMRLIFLIFLIFILLKVFSLPALVRNLPVTDFFPVSAYNKI